LHQALEVEIRARNRSLFANDELLEVERREVAHGSLVGAAVSGRDVRLVGGNKSAREGVLDDFGA
jgi:hypothetical protein